MIRLFKNILILDLVAHPKYRTKELTNLSPPRYACKCVVERPNDSNDLIIDVADDIFDNQIFLAAFSFNRLKELR